MTADDKLKILIIEDDPGLCVLIAEALEKEGLSCRTATDGEKAGQVLREQRFDLILLDYRLPDMTGLELIDSIRSGPVACPPFIMATGRGDEKTAIEVMKRGARDYIIKDTRFLDLLPKTVLRVLREVRNEAELEATREELKRAGELYKTIFERSSDAIFLVDRSSGTFLDANRAAEAMAGYTVEDIRAGAAPELRFAGSDKQLENPEDILTLTDPGELIFIRPDGSERHGIVTVVSHGQDLLVGIVHDITEYKQAEAALKESLNVSQVLNDILQLVNSSRTLKELYSAVHRSISPVLDTTNFFISLYDREEKRISFPYFTDEKDTVSDIIRELNVDDKNLITAMIIASGKSVLYREADLVRRYRELGKSQPGTMARIFLGVPLKIRDEVIGTIAVQSYSDPHLYSEKDLHFLETVSEAIAPAFERMMTEARLAEAELVNRKLSVAIEQSPVSVIITNAEGIIEYVNPCFSRVSGYSREDVLGQNPRILKSGRQTPDYYKKMWGEITKGNVWVGEFQNKAKDGHLFWERATIGPVLDPQGQLTHFIGIKEDITGIRDAQEKLRYTHDLYRHAIRNSRGVVYIHDIEADRFEYIDDLAREFFNLGETALTPRQMRSWVVEARMTDPEYSLMSFKDYTDAISTGHITQYNADLHLQFPDGREKWVFDCSLPLEKDSQGKVIKSLGILQDITDRVNAEEARQLLEDQLRQSQKLEGIGQLAGGIAHDFNNILTASFGFTEMILTNAEDGSMTQMAATQLQKTNERARNLVRQLLAFSRKEVYSPVSLNVDELLHDLTKMLHRLIGEDIEIKMDLKSADVHVMADPSQIEQIVMNLCVNSRDAIRMREEEPHDKHIYIRTEFQEHSESINIDGVDVAPGMYVRLSVEDTGAGMDKKTLSRIFDPFFTTKDVGKGTGLGLSTVYGIVKQNKGYIKAGSQPGQGTRINIYWPAVNTTKPRKLESDSGEDRVSSGHEHILIAEDDEMVREITAQSLKELGYRVSEARNGVEALEKAANPDYGIDLLLSDLTMPKMGGRVLAETILKIRPGLKVIFCSGYNEEIASNEGWNKKGIPLLSKPFSMAELSNTIRKTLDAKHDKTKGGSVR